ncbi:MAG: hypothetical protein ACKESC_01055 [Candidatus Hodgkinia cicadicola]
MDRMWLVFLRQPHNRHYIVYATAFREPLINGQTNCKPFDQNAAHDSPFAICSKNKSSECAEHSALSGFKGKMEVGTIGVCETGLWALGLALSGLRLCLTLGMLCGFGKLAILGLIKIHLVVLRKICSPTNLAQILSNFAQTIENTLEKTIVFGVRSSDRPVRIWIGRNHSLQLNILLGNKTCTQLNTVRKSAAANQIETHPPMSSNTNTS